MLMETKTSLCQNKMKDTKNWFTGNKAEILKLSLQKYDKTEKQLEEDIRTLKEWLKTQPHLPEIPSENHIMNTLFLNKFSIESCKQRLDMYYTIRTLMPEVYEDMNFEKILEIADKFYFIPLFKRSPDGDRITIIKVKEMNPEKIDAYSWIGYCFNILDLRMKEDVCSSEVFIYDLGSVTLSHLPRITPIHLKKTVLMAEKLFNNRLKQFHFINCPPFTNQVLKILRSFLKPKIAKRVFFHDDCSEIGKIIPFEVLPSDYGSSELSLSEINELWKQKLAENEDRFNALAKMRTDEKLRPAPLVNDEILGYHGNFKNLEMD